jgi:hypothetical protein
VDIDARTVNEQFLQKIGSADGKMAAEEAVTKYIRDRLREESFARMLIPPQEVTRADCQRSERHDTLIKMVDIEPRSAAMPLTFRGQPRAQYIQGKRVSVGFYTISTYKFVKTEQELMAYEMPVTKIIEDNMVKDVHEIEDRDFTLHAEACVQAMQKLSNSNTVTSLNYTTLAAGGVDEVAIRKGDVARQLGVNNAVVQPWQKTDVVNQKKMLSKTRLRTTRMLVSEPDWDDVGQWTLSDFGDKVLSETTVEGYKYDKIVGVSIVRTIKTDVLRPGNIYSFTAPDFLGKFFILNRLKFYIDKQANWFSFQAWEDIAMLFVNVAAIRKTELYSGDSTSLDADGLREDFIPVPLEDLGAPNHKIDEGIRFPKVPTF